jgi:hypothetical protein
MSFIIILTFFSPFPKWDFNSNLKFYLTITINSIKLELFPWRQGYSMCMWIHMEDCVWEHIFCGCMCVPKVIQICISVHVNQGQTGSSVQLLHEAVADVHNLPQEPSFNCIHTFCKKESCIFICKLHLIVPQLQLIIRWRFQRLSCLPYPFEGCKRIP